MVPPAMWRKRWRFPAGDRLQPRERVEHPAAVTAAGARRPRYPPRLETDVRAPREELHRLTRAARDGSLEPLERGGVARVVEGVVDDQEDRAVALRLALPHDPSPHARRLLPVEVARIVARDEIAQRPDVGAAPGTMGMRTAAPRVLGGHVGDGARLGHREDDDLAGHRRPAVLAEQTDRE